jgi:hypothetical protein
MHIPCTKDTYVTKVVFHLRKHSLRHQNALHDHKYLELFAKVQTLMQAEGIQVDIRPKASLPAPDGNLHIIEEGITPAPGVLNAGLAYLNGFWYLDPKGVRHASSIAAMPYSPAQVPMRRAMTFLENLRKWHITHRRSRYAQPGDTPHLPKGAIAVFLQGPDPRAHYKTTTHSDFTMVEAVAKGSQDTPIIVKLHPHLVDMADLVSITELAGRDRRIHIVDANVHDILENCLATVSINSSVAIEGFMHRKPAILFGDADFHHHAFPVERSGSFAGALAQARAQNGGHAQYLYWFLHEHCLPMHAPDLQGRIWARFAQAGFPQERFL